MNRKTALAAGIAAASMAVPGVASAATVKVTGGTTQITPSAQATALLSANKITVTPLAPATVSGSTFTFPIAGGRINATTLHGFIRDEGGISLSNGKKTVNVRRPTIDSTRRGVFVYGLVRESHRVCRGFGRRFGRFAHVFRARRCVTITRWDNVRIADVTGATVSGASATGTVKITRVTAALVNQLAGKRVVAAGAVLGTATLTPTFS
jgi:hypothetical protein